jgi:hypothetical protein
MTTNSHAPSAMCHWFVVTVVIVVMTTQVYIYVVVTVVMRFETHNAIVVIVVMTIKKHLAKSLRLLSCCHGCHDNKNPFSVTYTNTVCLYSIIFFYISNKLMTTLTTNSKKLVFSGISRHAKMTTSRQH